jgi:hypothetical protein
MYGSYQVPCESEGNFSIGKLLDSLPRDDAGKFNVDYCPDPE